MLLLTSQELADLFGVSLQSVHKWVKQLALPHHRTIGGQLRFDPRDVRAYCEKKGMVMPKRLIEMTENPWRRL